MPIRYKFYKLLRFLHLISKKKYKKRTACYRFMQSPDYQLIKRSKLFDSQWYLAHNPDVKQAGLDPIEHFLKFGWQENRDCTPYFDGKRYLQLYPDVAASRLNPLLHWEKYGKKEGRILKQISFQKKKSEIISCKAEKKYFFSVIVTSYNYQDYIQKTLDSLIKQTYKNFEVIVVDDGSTDDSLTIIQSYVRKYHFIKLYQHKNGENRGLPETVLLGVQKSKGEYIAFCESDDYWTSDHLFEINKKINSEANAKIVVNDVQIFGDEQRCIDMDKVVKHRKHAIISQKGLISDEAFAVSNYIITFSACSVRKDLLCGCNFVDVPKKTALDWWLWRQICYQNQILYLDKKLTYWRLHLSYNIKDVYGEEQKHTEFVKKLDEIMNKRKYDSVYRYNEKLSDISLSQILRLKTTRATIIQKLKNGNLQNIKICYVSATNQTDRPIGDGSVRYRCYHPAETLSSQGAFVTVVPHTIFLKSLSYNYDIYIFHRPCKSETSIINTLKKLGKIVIADYDDLIFGNQKVAEQSSVYKNLKISLKQISENFINNMEALLQFDFISVSTEALKQEILKIYPDANVTVVHNFIPDSILRLSNKLKVRDMPKDKDLLMYCTGTLSHNQDFAEIENTLLSCMEQDKKLKLLIFGVLTASEKFQKSSRVFFHNVVDYWDLFTSMSATAFTIAPLEKSSRFNECKSNVKFLESSIAGATLFATPIGDMKRVEKAAIQLCNKPDDWQQAILNRDQINLTQNIKQNFEYIVTNCSTDTFIHEFKSIFNNMEI